MEIETVWGVKWIKASSTEFIIISIFFLIIITIIFTLKYLQFKKDKNLHDQNLFLFKLKRLGLSNFQIKIVNNIAQILHLSNSNELLNNAELFENAIGKFLSFLRTKYENEDSLASICKDITITYDKLYNAITFKKALETIHDVEKKQLLYFTTPDNKIYLGKLVSKDEGTFSLKLFRNTKELQPLLTVSNIKVYIWRIGDAEYIFNSKTIKLDSNVLTIEIPEEFIRDKEFRHPFIDAFIPVILTKADPSPVEEAKQINGALYKINDYEALIRISEKIDYKHKYNIEFELMEFKFKIISIIIANKSVEENSINYYTLKFEEMSDAARNILSKYIYEHL